MSIKKIYFIGLITSLTMFIIRLYFVIDDLSAWVVVWRIIKTFFLVHFVGLLGFGMMKLQRIIFQSFFANLRIISIWIALLILTGFCLWTYITEINNSSLDFSQINTIFMMLAGALIENMYEKQKLHDQKIEAETENRLPEDTYEKKLLSGKKVS
ncbi:MAG TPA: hypothetical protein DEG42_00575 [Acholeplasmataceae bacterium]|nr:MAG: hypothetical protein A2013_02185 [Tenericutes bacterium GWE2_38_8]HBY64890.1 hypothetical protein [Acholeplasmataceae bacterium]HCB66682.1 hypothetical protein [Acholeplasmataceae bacterium]